MKRIIFLLFFPFLLSVGAYEPNSIDLQIINHTFNEEFDKAIKLSQEQIKLFPNSPKYYYYHINTKILEYYKKVAELEPGKRDEGRKLLNKEIIDYCESVIKKIDPSRLDTENKFYFGSIYAYLGRIYGIDGSWWSAFRAGMKSKNLMEEILEADPQFYDAYLALGMLYYYADRLSGITGFIAGVLGMSGDREKGLRYLQTAHDKGKLTYGQAALTLIEVYSSLEDNDYMAVKYFEEFLKRFPKSKRTLNSYCQRLLNIYNTNRVASLIQNDDENLINDYTKARYYDIIGKSDLAIKHAEDVIEKEDVSWRGALNNARYIIVFNGWLTGNNSLIKRHEALLDDRSKENFEISNKNEMHSKWIHQFSIYFASGKSVQELEDFAKLKPIFNNASGYESRFNLLMGLVYFKNNSFIKAEQFYRKALLSTNERDKYTAYKYLVDIYIKQNTDKSKVEKLLDDIDDFDNDRLTFRAKDLEKKYNL
jgi:hypothetical protein